MNSALQAAPPPPARHESLQVYRAIAAFAVVLHHVNGKFGAPHYYGDVVPQVFSLGQAGVDFFFVLSGFIIAQSLTRSRTAGAFLLQRGLRVFPPFWLAFFVTLPVALYFSGQLHAPPGTDGLSLAKAALLLPQPAPPVIGVAWTLHHEVLFYALAGAWIRAPIPVSVVAAILLLGSGWKFDSFIAQFLFSPFHWEFVAGIGAFLLAPQLSPRTARVLALTAGAAAVAACVWFALNDAFFGGLARFFTLAPLFALLVAASTRWNAAPDPHPSRFMRVGSAFGDSSYTLYLWHIPIVTPLAKMVFKVLPALAPGFVLLMTVLIAVVATAIAHLIYRRVEQPMVGALRKRLLRGVSRARGGAAREAP